MQNTRRLISLILVLGVLLAAGTSVWLAILYSGSMAQKPDIVARFGRAVAEAQDLQILKTSCLMLAEAKEGERIERLYFLLVSAGAAIVVGLLSAGISARLLFVLKADQARTQSR